ncbi:arylsulfatase [Sunxiuqinia indica]|uniref:arylsulfatase n=1 Tax=Sunxiuqinia indica TaxID=2692584 RepID=UPI00135CD514|nr:arylsulfatase [Sunxiuqinia indica]
MKLNGNIVTGINYLCIAILGSLFFSCSNKVSTTEKETKERPNIVLILADDMGYSDLSCYGGEISTPNIDKIASHGVRFSQFYNAARCCPTRASLMTGLYPHQAGMGAMVKLHGEAAKGPYQGYLNDQCVTIAEVLKQAGYYTAASGKWHIGEERPQWPIDRGFDNYYGLISGAANYFDISRGKSKNVVRHFAIDSTEIMPSKEGFYMTEAITDHAVQFLQKAATKDQPFFLYLPYTAPHWPLHALQEDIALYKGKFMKGWDELREERYNRMVELGLIDKEWLKSDRNEDVSSWDSLSQEQKEQMDQLMAIFAAQIHRMDIGIGQVMDQLEKMGALENTVVFFLSDNGGSSEYGIWGTDFWGNFWDGKALPGSGDSFHSYGASWANLSNTPFRYYKKYVHEGGIATPFIVSWPETIKDTGGISHVPGHVIDIMTTICDVTNVEYPKVFKNHQITPMPGRSILPALLGEQKMDTDTIFWEHMGNRAVRIGNWKLVSIKGSPWELYNLEKDRTETNNLIENEPARAAEMKATYESWAKKIGV